MLRTSDPREMSSRTDIPISLIPQPANADVWHMNVRQFRCLPITFLFAALLGSSLCFGAQTSDSEQSALPAAASEQPCSSEVTATPTRPNFSVSTDTTKCGVVEADYGWGREWSGAGVGSSAFQSSLRFGVTPNLDVRWGSDNRDSSIANGDTIAGIGDNWLGARYRFNEQRKILPAFAFSYTAKLPTASPSKGFGTGYADHAFALLASKDLRKYHFDLNVAGSLLGQETGISGSTVLALACTRPLSNKLSLVTEGYGQVDGERSAAALLGATYAVTPRFVLDLGVDNKIAGESLGEPHLVIGGTYAIGNIYSALRRWQR
jgi:Putative MetA-pathway of phenol degradation